MPGVEELLAVAELFRSAALDGASWLAALDALAQATGARSGDLIGVRPDRVAFEWASQVDPQLWVDLDDRVRGDPGVNPRVRNAVTAAPMTVLSSVDYASDAWTRRFPEYGEACRRYDLGGGSQAVLHRSTAGFVGLATLRSSRQGLPTGEQTRVFARLAPKVMDAVRLRRMVEDQGARFAVGALDTVMATAFLCDESGQVRAMTRAAEALVGPGGALRLKNGWLSGGREDHAESIAATIRRAIRTPATPVQTVVMRDRQDAPMIVEIAPLPKDPWSMAFHPRVIVTVKRRARPPTTDHLRLAFGLTLAEAEVALAVAEGRSRNDIAATRGVTPGTVKSQLQAIFGKLGVNRESEVAVLLNGL